MLRWYQAKLATRPVLTQALTTAVLFGTGDILAQQAVERVGFEKHNYARTGRMALYGGCVFGPGATLWYRALQRINLRSSTTSTIARVVADQTIFTPINLTLFLSSMAYLEGASPRERLQTTWWTALKKNWLVWPAVQSVNFTMVPLDYRVLVVNFVSLGWNCYLSWVNAQGGKGKEKVEEVKEDVRSEAVGVEGSFRKEIKKVKDKVI